MSLGSARHYKLFWIFLLELKYFHQYSLKSSYFWCFSWISLVIYGKSILIKMNFLFTFSFPIFKQLAGFAFLAAFNARRGDADGLKTKIKLRRTLRMLILVLRWPDLPSWFEKESSFGREVAAKAKFRSYHKMAPHRRGCFDAVSIPLRRIWKGWI